MSLNFFKQDCQYPPISSPSFGLCDKEDGTKAYPDLTTSDLWIAEVKNANGLQILFTAIDKCVLYDDEYEGRGRCDGMLTTNRHLYLVELKDQWKDWQVDARNQLLSTINFILENHDISEYKLKKAFACNKKHRRFAYTDNEENLALFKRTGFRLDIQAEIIII